MNILHISAECYPFVKIGGLADVVGSLPGEIKKLRGNELRVMLPKYKAIPKKYLKKMTYLTHFSIKLGDVNEVYVGVETLKLGNILYYFIDNQFYFGSRDQVYGYGDEAERYAYFQKAAVEAINYIDFLPELIHIHDWHTGMIPMILKYHPTLSNIRTVLSIHNLAYQGIYPIETYRFFNIPYDGLFEFEGYINFLKAGIVTANYLSTVSPTYAKETMTDYYGYGMQKLLKTRKSTYVGILNGISYKEFNPETDKLIAQNYNEFSYKEGKKKNKAALYKKMNAPFSVGKPMVSIISRLVSQKGLDLVKRVLEEMLEIDDFVFVVLGSGEKEFEDYFKEMSIKYPDKVAVHIGYSNALAHMIYSASDFFLMPSKFEPCGLGQMIALKYGTLPIVRETGGLLDSIQPYNEYEKSGNGFSFSNYNAHDMMYVIRYALHTYYDDEPSLNLLIQNAMNSDFSWKQSAKTYKKLYKRVMKG